MVATKGQLSAPDPDRSLPDQLSRMIMGGRIAQIIAVAAELGIPDRLKDGPRTSDELAVATSTHAPSLHRLMQALAALGLVNVETAGFALTPLGSVLRSDRPERLDLFARYAGHDAVWRTWGHLLHSIRTGEAAFPDVFRMQAWEYREQNPDFGQLFDDWMTAGSVRRQDAILPAYDFSRFRTVVDVAGGHGQLLGAILQQYPALRGILFDQPHVLAGAAGTLEGLGVQDRCTTFGGSFFDTVPTGDAYLLKFILHDWDDDQAVSILRTVSRAMTPDAILLAIDRVLPPEEPPDLNAAVMDLHMLVCFAGKERTEQEFRSLYDRAGFRLTRILKTESDVSLIEGVRAERPVAPTAQ